MPRIAGLMIVALAINTLLSLALFSSEKYANYKEIIDETRVNSLELRQNLLKRYIALDPASKSIFPPPEWKSVSWELVALHLNQKTDLANERLYEAAIKYTAKINSGNYGEHDLHDLHGVNGKKGKSNKQARLLYVPEGQEQRPFNFFSGPEYLEILYKYGSEGLVAKGRLKPKTEAAMKAYMWLVVSQESKLIEAEMDRLLTYHGTENHDILRRPVFYLMNYLFMKDPLYKHRRYKYGGTAEEHYKAYRDYFMARPAARAIAGSWVEAGSNTYNKYTAPMLLTMSVIAPDPLIRKRYQMLLDLYFIEEAIFSVEGRRGGGRSRADWGTTGLEKIKNMLYGIAERGGGSSHNKVFEVSRYQLPDSAIVLRKIEFPSAEPFEIINRTIGERMAEGHYGHDGSSVSYERNGRIVNYAYRTPHYIIGGHQFNPSLKRMNTHRGWLESKYAGISRQKRWGGIIFDHPDTRAPDLIKTISAIGPEIEGTDYSPDGKRISGRPQNSFWAIYKKNIMLMQRIPSTRKSRLGSYQTDRLSMLFYGKNLKKVENKGWIFATDGQAFAAVKLLDGRYVWNMDKDMIRPSQHSPKDKTRYLIHAGDLQSYGSFENFMDVILKNKLFVKPDSVSYEAEKEKISITKFTFDPGNPKTFKQPLINGKEPDLTPKWTYRSPYMNSLFSETKVMVTVGPVKEVYDFKAE